MTDHSPVLYILCGKIASGKSTLASELAANTRGVVVAEDVWLHALFSDELNSPDDYFRYARRLRKTLKSHVVDLLNAGVSVILDFQANTVQSRQWMKSIIKDANVDHELHLLNASDRQCLDRLASRNAKGDHPFQVSEAEYWQVTRHFTVPSEDEGFKITVHDEND